VVERKSVLLRLDPAVHDALARWAGDELRSTNAQIEFLLRRALADAGRMPGHAARIARRGRPPRQPTDGDPTADPTADPAPDPAPDPTADPTADPAPDPTGDGGTDGRTDAGGTDAGGQVDPAGGEPAAGGGRADT
jgi:hypothetical protein